MEFPVDYARHIARDLSRNADFGEYAIYFDLGRVSVSFARWSAGHLASLRLSAFDVFAATFRRLWLRCLQNRLDAIVSVA